MKKVLFALFALVLCMGMTSCGGPDLKSLAEKAEKEGANWSVDEWKTQFKDFCKALAPISKEAKELDKKIEEEKDEAKKAELQKQADEKFGDAKKAAEKFMEVAAKSDKFIELMKDKEFEKELEKEFPDMDL